MQISHTLRREWPVVRHLQGTSRRCAPRLVPPHTKQTLSCFGSEDFYKGEAASATSRPLLSWTVPEACNSALFRLLLVALRVARCSVSEGGSPPLSDSEAPLLCPVCLEVSIGSTGRRNVPSLGTLRRNQRNGDHVLGLDASFYTSGTGKTFFGRLLEGKERLLFV